MVTLATWIETTIFWSMAFPHERAPCGMKSLRSDTLTMRVTGVRITVFSSAIVIGVIVHCHTAGPFESNGRKHLSLSSCGWVLIRSGQFKITLVAEVNDTSDSVTVLESIPSSMTNLSTHGSPRSCFQHFIRFPLLRKPLLVNIPF